MRGLALPFAMFLGACTPGPALQPVEPATRAVASFAGDMSLPPMKTFGTRETPRPRVSNADLAVDFLELSFALESGRALPLLTRFEGPITVRVTGRPPASLAPDLARLIQRLRAEAGIDVSRTDTADANITIEAVSRRDIHRALPDAACFVVPNVASLREYRSARRSDRTSWTALTERQRLAIFVPNDVSPQETRDCLHEELAQALGPLNDLYRLPDSVFNDDNIHTVLTGYDMLVLRAYYDRSLRSGMSRSEVAARLPGILARINPAGEKTPARVAGPTPRDWADALKDALGKTATNAQRRRAVTRALRIAEDLGWQDHRSAFAHYAAGRLSQGSDPARAMAHFRRADAIYRSDPGTELQRAYVATQIAAHAVGKGDGERALATVTPHIPVAAENENAALLATLLLLKAEALELLGRVAEADRVRLDSLGWARYGFGSDRAVRAKLREAAALNPLNMRG